MTQTVPATCVLGPGLTGLTIGLRVLNLDGTEYAAFSTTGVAETSTAGTYRKAGGVVAPLAGGYIVWGTALVDYAEATVESASANVTMQAGVAVAAADVNGNVPVVLYGTQPDVTFGKITINSGGYQPALHIVSNLSNAISGATGLMVGLTSPGVAQVTDAVPDAQDIADALLLAPSGAAAAGSAMAELAAILADSNELQTDWANGGRLDVILDAAAAGGGLDAAGVRAAVGLAAANLDTQLATLALEATAQAILAVIGAGSGTGLYTDTITNGSTPLDGVRVQLSTDEAGEHRVYETFTNALGVFVLRPDPGTYYRWLDLAGITFEQGIEVEVL